VTLKRLIIVWVLACPSAAWATHTEHVVLVTLDGVRWQDVFRGAAPELLADETYVKDASVRARFQGDTLKQRRVKLLPFFWHRLAKDGVVWGDRDQNSRASVTNPYYFSYPGYNEMLTGVADPAIDSNDNVWNPNVTVLEWLEAQDRFAGKVAAFASWEAFTYILNTRRSGLAVNAGYVPARGSPLGASLELLNVLQSQVPQFWEGERVDAFTHHYAMDALRTQRPSILYISYGDTDEFAHAGQYDAYLQAMNRCDAFLEELWRTLQADPYYQGKTALIVTTDHGRGERPLDAWRHHASQQVVAGQPDYLKQYPRGIVGSDQVWIAVMGPDTPARGVLANVEPVFTNQVAASVARLLGLNFNSAYPQAGVALPGLVE